MRKLTKEQKRDIRAIAAKRDEDFDFSDAPAVVDWSGAEIGKSYRPTKGKPVTMRLDSDVIAWPATIATGLLKAQKKFRRVKGYRELELLHRRMNPSLTQQAQVA